MHRTLSQLLSDAKKGDLKSCSKCKKINWYENENCVNCGNTKFKKNDKKIVAEIQSDYKFWKGQGYSEYESDNIEGDF